VLLATDGSANGLLTVKGGGSGTPYKPGETLRRDFFVEMNGREVFKYAVRNMTSICKQVLEKHALGKEQVDVFIPHQANLRIIEAVGSRLDIPAEKVFVNLQKYGNTSAASVIIALSEARAEGFIKDGDLVLLGTFGGGFTWGSALVRF
jgi:3-oxoacyl-[acyl-carrier-protein] synthase-3